MTRGRLLLSRAIGAEHARSIAAAPSLVDGIATLAGSAYGERVQPRTDLAAAERAVGATLLWHLRILAGWLPAAGAGVVRALAAWFELANIDARLAALAGDGREPPPYELGALATAWPRIEPARTVEDVAHALVGSAWAPAAGRSAAELSLALRVAWARRVRDAAPEASDWVAGAGALLVARELLTGEGRRYSEQLRRLPDVGEGALASTSVSDIRSALPARAAWALADVEDPRELWRAELGWWVRIEQEARGLLLTGSDESTVIAAVALLAADAQRTARALRAAAGGGDPDLMELFDAVA